MIQPGRDYNYPTSSGNPAAIQGMRYVPQGVMAILLVAVLILIGMHLFGGRRRHRR